MSPENKALVERVRASAARKIAFGDREREANSAGLVSQASAHKCSAERVARELEYLAPQLATALEAESARADAAERRATRKSEAALALSKELEAAEAKLKVARDTLEMAKRAFSLARNSAAGLTNYCEESASSRKCERQLEEAESMWRDADVDAALAQLNPEKP